MHEKSEFDSQYYRKVHQRESFRVHALIHLKVFDQPSKKTIRDKNRDRDRDKDRDRDRDSGWGCRLQFESDCSLLVSLIETGEP
jgi:hypothetical protein